MEIRVYNPQLQLLGIIDAFTSLQWVRRYSMVGQFELHVPISDDSVNYLKRGNIVAYLGASEAGVIEYLRVEESGEKSDFMVAGRFLESYLDRRLIYTNKGTFTTGTAHTFNYSGRTEVGMRTLLSDAIAIPLITMYNTTGTDPGELHGYTETISFQATFQNLLKYENKLAESAGFGFRCMPDFVNRIIIFDVYKGLDHSERQSDRVRVTFSDGYGNLESATYTENDQLYKNVCYVGGRGEGANRTWVVVGDTTATGLNLREVRLNATDIEDDDISAADYKAKLSQRGQDLLENEDILIRSFECDTMPDGNFSYKKHYDIGDIVTVTKEAWGISLDLRITEIAEIYEDGIVTIAPIFGNPLPNTIEWEDE